MMQGNVDSSYEFPVYEKHLVHVRLEAPQYNSLTGAKESSPFVKKLYVEVFKKMEETAGFAHFKVDFLHDPSKGDVLNVKRHHVAGDQSKPESIVNYATDGSYNLESIPDYKLDRMTKAELRAKYKELYGEDAPEELKNEDLKGDIKLRLDFLAGEAK